MHDEAPAGTKPPKAKAASCVPAPAKSYLAVDKAPPADHESPLYSSVHDEKPASTPPKASAAFCVPAPAKLRLAIIKAPPADHTPGSYVLIKLVVPTEFVSPCTLNEPVILLVPMVVIEPEDVNEPVEISVFVDGLTVNIAVLNDGGGVYSSVHDKADGAAPPKANAAFCSPAPANSRLAVIKAPPADHEVPLYSSVHD